MLKTIFLGIIQGLTEFLPVSSSGHLVLFQKIFNMPETGLLLEILLHVGTLISVIVIFWYDWWEMLRHPIRNKTFSLLVVATIPAVIVALLFEDAIDRAFGGWFLGPSFIITGIMLIASDWLAWHARRNGHRRSAVVENMRYEQALAMGMMQAVAVIPGISRSGSTMVGGLAVGVPRKTAAKFSFMMSAIATAGSLVLKLKDIIGMETVIFEGGWLAAIAGMVAAMVSGFLAIRWMLKLIQRVSLKWFGFYTCLLGILVLLDQFVFGIVLDKINLG